MYNSSATNHKVYVLVLSYSLLLICKTAEIKSTGVSPLQQKKSIYAKHFSQSPKEHCVPSQNHNTSSSQLFYRRITDIKKL